MKLVIIGFGRRIAAVLSELEESFKRAEQPLEISGYFDAEDSSYGQGVKRYDSEKELLDAVSPDIVLIGSPTHKHLEQIKLALEYGAQVLTEKPAVLDRAQTKDLLNFLKDKDKSRVMVGFPLRSAPVFRKAQEILSGEGIGRLVSMEANELLVPYHGAYIATGWRRKAEYGGSYLLDKAIHDFDLFGFLVQAPPHRIVSFGGRKIFTEENKTRLQQLHKEHQIYDSLSYGNDMVTSWSARADAFDSDTDITDYQSVMIEYENEVVLTFHSNTHSAMPQRYVQLVGTEGVLRVDFTANELLYKRIESRDPPAIIKIDIGGEHYGADPAMADDLRDAFLGRKPFTSTIEDGLLAGLTVMAADESLATGTVVNFAEFTENIL